tara:strand:+ start:606 stop:1031 length:426 start_codon:yes stop_codon:yes gene_type:complete
MKLKRGQKLCKSCKVVNAARSRLCKNCGKPFVSKNTPIKNEVKDWKSLERGDSLRVVQGTGPYFVCSMDSEESEVGEKIYMGCKGKYEVVEVVRDGLLCVGTGKKNRGVEFVYMGERSISQITGIIKSPHRIVKLRTRKRK